MAHAAESDVFPVAGGKQYLVGIDAGSTLTKAIVVASDGRVVAVGKAAVPQLEPHPHHVERDMEAAWRGAAQAVREALEAGGVAPAAIAAIGVTGHGDGLYCLDGGGEPLGHGILSLDSRAQPVVAAWGESGVLERVLPIVGQHPYCYSAASLLGWIKRHEPQRYAAIGHVLFCKDWLRFRLTGRIATDLTEASTSFTDVQTQRYSEELLRLLELAEIGTALPEILESDSLAGRLSADAARATGLLEGTPVAAGLHDVTAAAVGLGNLEPGDLTITAGTFSINEVISTRPQVDHNASGPRWSCRAGVHRGNWMNMSISPASSANLDWLLRQLGSTDPGAKLAAIEPELDRAALAASSPIYHPFLYGSPYAAPASAAFLGLKSWHRQADLLEAVLEGIVFNHRWHVDALADGFAVKRVRLTGGGSHRPRMAQLFADGLGREIEIPSQSEAAAFGAALCGGVAAGLFPDLAAAAATCCRIEGRYTPEPGRQAVLSRKYELYARLIEALQPIWPAFEPADRTEG